MTELEKVEKLREKANVSYAEAKEALEIVGGDILDALIYLEKQGKSTVPAGGGFFSGAGDYSEGQQPADEPGTRAGSGETFGDMMRRFGRFCMKVLDRGNNNFLDAIKGDNTMFSCPITALVVLLIFFFWIVVPLFILSLFLGFRYRFRGADLDRESFNRVMDGASNVVDDVKKSFADNAHKTHNADEQ